MLIPWREPASAGQSSNHLRIVPASNSSSCLLAQISKRIREPKRFPENPASQGNKSTQTPGYFAGAWTPPHTDRPAKLVLNCIKYCFPCSPNQEWSRRTLCQYYLHI